MIRSRLVCLKHIGFALVALLLLVVAGEVGLRVYDSYSGEFSRPADDPLTAPSWQTHHRLKPLRRLVRPNADTGEPIIVATSSYGTRGPDVLVPKPPKVYRVICLGDEATLAADVGEGETFCARLREFLQPHARLQIEVINAGVPGYCPLLSCLQVKHALLALQPDLLVLNFDMSDVADDHQYRRHTHRDERGVPLACPHPELEARNDRRPIRWDDRLLLARWIKRQSDWLVQQGGSDERRDIDAARGRYAWLKDNPPDWSVYVQQALSPIEHLSATADAVYARLVVATYPCPWQVSPRAGSVEARASAGIRPDAVYRNRAPLDLLANWLERRRILFCDASPAFQDAAYPEDLFLRNAPCFSPAGHDLYARELAGFLVAHLPEVFGGSGPSYAPVRPHAMEDRWNGIDRR